jgi:hypothetical protein
MRRYPGERENLPVPLDQFLKSHSTRWPLFIGHQEGIGFFRLLLAGQQGFGSVQQDPAAQLVRGEQLVRPQDAPQLCHGFQLLGGEFDGDFGFHGRSCNPAAR